MLMFGCSKDDDGGDGGSAANGKVTAKVDGQSFSSMTIATMVVLTNAGGTTILRVQGSDADGKGITLMVSGFEGEGTYDIGGGANVFSNASYLEANASNPAQSKAWMAPYDDSVAGEVKISEKTDMKVKGTFFFKAKNEENGSIKEIKNGSFNVSF